MQNYVQRRKEKLREQREARDGGPGSSPKPGGGERQTSRAQTSGSNAHEHDYNEKAVNEAIASSTRSGRKIGGKEARAIHSVLKGWRG